MAAFPMFTTLDRESHPICLRAHTLLCLHGFQGLGYSAAFVEQMTAIHDRLMHEPRQMIEVIDAPDAICSACPHHLVTGCSLNAPDSETDMRAQDREVLTRLGIRAGERLQWGEVQQRIARAIEPDSLSDICGGCRWLPLGYCRTGLARLRSQEGQR